MLLTGNMSTIILCAFSLRRWNMERLLPSFERVLISIWLWKAAKPYIGGGIFFKQIIAAPPCTSLQSSRGRYTLTYASVTTLLVLSFSENIPVTRSVRLAHFFLTKSKKMSNPTPVAKPGSADNPRVFFDVDIGGERGQDVLFFFWKKLNDCMLLCSATCQ